MHHTAYSRVRCTFRTNKQIVKVKSKIIQLMRTGFQQVMHFYTLNTTRRKNLVQCVVIVNVLCALILAHNKCRAITLVALKSVNYYFRLAMNGIF